MIKNCCLITPIAPSYLRNNRSTRQKSLRCFPTCSPKGHIMGGFCGQSLRVNLSLDIGPFQDRRIDINDFVFICEIRPSDEPRIAAETTIRKAIVLDKVRSKQDKDIGKELFMGDVVSCEQLENELNLEVIFNGRHHSWDYSWKSNRWSEQQHVVDIIVLTYDSPLDFRVAGIFTSSQFMILSSHKKSSKGEKQTYGTGVVSLATSRMNKPAAVATIAAAAAAAGSNDTTDQDLLDASNALSMLAGGGGKAILSDKHGETDDGEEKEQLLMKNSKINLSNISRTSSSGNLQHSSMQLTDMVLLPRSKVSVGNDVIPSPMSLAMAGSNTNFKLSSFENNAARLLTPSHGHGDTNKYRSNSSATDSVILNNQINNDHSSKPRQLLSHLSGELNHNHSHILSHSQALPEDSNLIVLPNRSRTESLSEVPIMPIARSGSNGAKPSSTVMSNMCIHYGQHNDGSSMDSFGKDSWEKQGDVSDKGIAAQVNSLYHFPHLMPVMPTTTIASIAAATLKDFNSTPGAPSLNPSYPVHENNEDMIMLMPRNKKAKLQ